jgi:DNA-binding HxlR family transcriptional regulator
MEKRRRYRQFCGLARALDVVGERWTLLVVRNLLLGPRRYSELLAELPGVTTNLLAKRLREMEKAGLVARDGAGAYALGASGAALEPAIMELARWGGRYMDTPRRDDRVDIAWALLSLKRRYRGGLGLIVELRVDGRVFTLAFSPEYLRVGEGAADRPDLVVAGALAAVRALLFGGAAGPELRRRGELTVAGEARCWRALLGAFAAPAVAHSVSSRSFEAIRSAR